MMNAVTGFVAIVSLLLALAAAGGATKEQAEVNSPTATRGTTSLCPTCGGNHNETMVSDAPSVQQTDLLSQWLTSVQEFVFTSFSTYARGEEPPVCPMCGGNHNETLVRDAMK